MDSAPTGWEKTYHKDFASLTWTTALLLKAQQAYVFKKKKKSYSIPFALPLAPEVLPLPSYGFF